LELEIAEPFLPLFDPQNEHYHKRVLSWYGGRGSGKTVSVAKGILMRGVRHPERVLCAREFMNSLADSSHKTLADEIEELGLQSFYEVQNNGIYGENGTEFLFRGLRHNVQSIKSLAGITIFWGDEAQTISKTSWEVLIPTIRAPGSQLITTWNPDSEEAATYQMLVKNPPPPEECYIRKINWDQNPWFPPDLRKHMEHMRRTDPDRAAHVYDGECYALTEAQVLGGKWIVDDSPVPEGADRLQGLDHGFSVDPLAFVLCWLKDNTLYITHELYQVGLEIRDTAAAIARVVPDAAKYTIRADNARPETNSHLVNDGLRVVGVEKWKGSVEDGIAFLRSLDNIVIHPRCVNMVREARLYSFKKNRAGDIMPEPEDKWNHLVDALRYALAPIIKRSGPGAGFLQFIATQKPDEVRESPKSWTSFLPP
jgi:phage terminase large subunit